MSARPALAVVLAALVPLAGCGTFGGGGAETSDAAYLLSLRLADTIGRCWFAPGETAFAAYKYSPERNADQSRILIVKKDNPTGLPALVIDATSGTSANVYGPLAATAIGPRVRADVDRWVKGSTTCS